MHLKLSFSAVYTTEVLNGDYIYRMVVDAGVKGVGFLVSTMGLEVSVKL